MLTRVRSIAARLAGVTALLGLLFLAMADDASTDIPFFCPDSVSAGFPIAGYAYEFTPPVTLAACFAGSAGNHLQGSPQSFNNSGKAYFYYPTTEPMAGSVVIITAFDSAGQVGSKAVLITN